MAETLFLLGGVEAKDDVLYKSAKLGESVITPRSSGYLCVTLPGTCPQ